MPQPEPSLEAIRVTLKDASFGYCSLRNPEYVRDVTYLLGLLHAAGAERDRLVADVLRLQGEVNDLRGVDPELDALLAELGGES